MKHQDDMPENRKAIPMGRKPYDIFSLDTDVIPFVISLEGETRVRNTDISGLRGNLTAEKSQGGYYSTASQNVIATRGK